MGNFSYEDSLISEDSTRIAMVFVRKILFFLQGLILFTIFADVLLWMAGDESLVR